MLVMPAIHEFEGHPWGWHRLKDLVKAFNNILSKQKGHQTYFDSRSLVKNFSALTRDGKNLCGIVWTYRGKSKWLRSCVCLSDFSFPGAFVPAGWGIAVIDAVKKGITEDEIVVNGDTCERQGIKEDGPSLLLKVV